MVMKHAYFAILYFWILETDHPDVPFVTLMDVLTHPEVPYLIQSLNLSVTVAVDLGHNIYG